jgi:hypothetical protein
MAWGPGIDAIPIEVNHAVASSAPGPTTLDGAAYILVEEPVRAQALG